MCWRGRGLLQGEGKPDEVTRLPQIKERARERSRALSFTLRVDDSEGRRPLPLGWRSATPRGSTVLPPNQRPSTPGGISVPTPGWGGWGAYARPRKPPSRSIALRRWPDIAPHRLERQAVRRAPLARPPSGATARRTRKAPSCFTKTPAAQASRNGEATGYFAVAHKRLALQASQNGGGLVVRPLFDCDLRICTEVHKQPQATSCQAKVVEQLCAMLFL